ncbi:MAG: glycosyl hydrolase [Verrucomicrobiota bacterium]
MIQTTLDTFRNPGAEFRGAPFWAWNGKLNPEELRRQIRIMHRMGLGGFFMHSRVGLDTPYMSEEWMQCVEACLGEAEKLGMRAWLYDEDRWPSGAAGGLVTKNPEYQQRALYLEATRDPASLVRTDDTLAVFAARISEHRASDVRPLEPNEPAGKLADDEFLLHFRVRRDEPSSWYNGATYLDTLNEDAVREFISRTHAAYAERFSDRFGAVIPGIFTDEPQHAGKDIQSAGPGGTPRGHLPWTRRLPEVFRERYGYDLLPHLVELFFDIEGMPAPPARYHFHDCLAHLFVDAFSRQIGEWCEQHNLLHTGHLMEEPPLIRQASKVTNCMRFYEHMQAPGIDLLGQYNAEYDTAKQVSSVARQFGRRWRLTETYGVTGWDFPWNGHKALGDWQAALGINLRCQHLSWYTMEGEAKRDYPASMLHQSPWWRWYDKVETYFGRINSILSRGRELRDLLFIHPIESTWTQIRADWKQGREARELETNMYSLRHALLSENLDFDYGDEDILARHARISQDPATGAPILHVAQAEYRAVVLPAMITMRGTTLDLLRRFHEAGGTVVFAASPASLLDAEPSAAVAEFAKSCSVADSPDETPPLLSAAARLVSITDENGREIPSVLHQLREDDQAQYLFACNTSDDFSRGLRNHPPVRERCVEIPEALICGFRNCAGKPVELDPETGAAYDVEACRDDGGWLIKTSFGRLQSRLFMVPKAAESTIETVSTPERTERLLAEQELDDERWELALSEPNVLVLDRPAWRLDGEEWQTPEEVLRIDQRVREALGIPPRGGRMKQPWAQEPVENPRSVDLTLRFEVQVEDLPTGPLWLGIENSAEFSILFNGHPVDTIAEEGYWVDPSLRRIPIDPADVKRGENHLELQIRYREMFPGLESMFLLGDFGVKLAGADAALTAPPRTLAPGDWCGQGLPFYSGNVLYRQPFEPKIEDGKRIIIKLSAYEGVAVRVLVDGEEAGIAAWDPNEVDITDLVAGRQRVTLGLEVLGHRRNSHGPLHLTDKNPRWLGSKQFISTGDLWSDEYQLVPCGLMAPPKIQVRG